MTHSNIIHVSKEDSGYSVWTKSESLGPLVKDPKVKSTLTHLGSVIQAPFYINGPLFQMTVANIEKICQSFLALKQAPAEIEKARESLEKRTYPSVPEKIYRALTELGKPGDGIPKMTVDNIRSFFFDHDKPFHLDEALTEYQNELDLRAKVSDKEFVAIQFNKRKEAQEIIEAPDSFVETAHKTYEAAISQTGLLITMS